MIEDAFLGPDDIPPKSPLSTPLLIFSCVMFAAACYYLPAPTGDPTPHACDDAYVDIELGYFKDTYREDTLRSSERAFTASATFPITRANLRCLAALMQGEELP